MFLLIDKPKGITSHDVIDKVRGVTGEKKVGHAGTLDPNATGLLVVGVGREFTRKLGDISKNTKKTYVAEITLGKEKDTDDAEGVITASVKGFLPPPEKEIIKILKEFKGKQKQIPPAFSAIKIKGKKAYEFARKGEKVSIKPRNIEIYSIKLLRYDYPCLEIVCKVSSGTYIRTLARDIGKVVGCGAYLNNLRRTRVGKFKIEKAADVKFLTKDNIRNFMYS